MPDQNHAAQYFLFMKWFKTHHPLLYQNNKLHIIVPTESHQIAAAMDYIEPGDKAKVQAAIKEYYSTAFD